MTQTVRNYQKELERILEQISGGANAETAGPDAGADETPAAAAAVPALLLHSCCAPCSSYVLEYLSAFFRITVFYYNPNIYPPEEYARRVQEQKRLAEELLTVHPVTVIEGRYDDREFYDAVRGLEQIPEGGERCHACFRLRLNEAARVAAEGGYDYFTTTLTISPLKNAAKLNEIGEAAAARFGVRWLPSDFKKKNGYKRSIELSAVYGLYRQDYCGCVFSMQEQQRRRQEKTL